MPIHNIDIVDNFNKKTVGDLDFLVTVQQGSNVMTHFVDYEDMEHVISRGEPRSSVVLRRGTQVDLRVVSQAGCGSALHYFTGSEVNNINFFKDFPALLTTAMFVAVDASLVRDMFKRAKKTHWPSFSSMKSTSSALVTI